MAGFLVSAGVYVDGGDTQPARTAMRAPQWADHPTPAAALDAWFLPAAPLPSYQLAWLGQVPLPQGRFPRRVPEVDGPDPTQPPFYLTIPGMLVWHPQESNAPRRPAAAPAAEHPPQFAAQLDGLSLGVPWQGPEAPAPRPAPGRRSDPQPGAPYAFALDELAGFPLAWDNPTVPAPRPAPRPARADVFDQTYSWLFVAPAGGQAWGLAHLGQDPVPARYVQRVDAAPAGEPPPPAPATDWPVWLTSMPPVAERRPRAPARAAYAPWDQAPETWLPVLPSTSVFLAYDTQQAPPPRRTHARQAEGSQSFTLTDASLLSGVLLSFPQEPGPARRPWLSRAPQAASSQQAEAWWQGVGVVLVPGPYWCAAGQVFTAGAVAGVVVTE